MSDTANAAPKVKICGLTCFNDVDAVNAAQADFAGLVLWPSSKRAVSETLAHALKQRLNDTITCVGVFVDEQPERIARLFTQGIIHIAQLHGHEDEAYLAQLRSLAPKLTLWKAFVIRTADDLIPASTSSADLVLLDGGLGDGRPFNWKLLSTFERPFALAGGLNCSNVADAIRYLHPNLVDVSSGVECSSCPTGEQPRKDASLIHAFMTVVRTAYDMTLCNTQLCEHLTLLSCETSPSSYEHINTTQTCFIASTDNSKKG